MDYLKSLIRYGYLPYVLLWVLLAGGSRLLYRIIIPEIPDAGMVPIAIVPWFFFQYAMSESGNFVILEMLGVWFLACTAYVVPQLYISLQQTTKKGVIAQIILFLLQSAYSAWIIWSIRGSFFFERKYSSTGAIGLLTPAFLWDVLLLLLGVIVGSLLRKYGKGRIFTLFQVKTGVGPRQVVGGRGDRRKNSRFFGLKRPFLRPI